jgi:hypothetical protein
MTPCDLLCANDAESAKAPVSLREILDADHAEFSWEPRADSWLSRWDERGN